MEYTYEEAVSLIKDRIDIVEIISEDVILKQKGSSYWGCCPFHGEKTPSFCVTPSKGIFHCFGCGVGGDAISFLMKIRNWDFNEAIKYLADKYGIELPKFKGKSGEFAQVKDGAIEASKRAVSIFKQSLFDLTEKSPIIQYLNGRDIDKNVIEKYSLGFGLKEPDYLYKKLKKDFSDEVLEASGLVIKGNRGYIDRFRNRIIIPIQDEKGNYVAFGARAVEDGQNPKYLNSPDTVIYNKSRILYGLYTAKDSIKEKDSVIIMEGYFDVISAQAHGIENCVASCGTSLTAEHVKLLARYTKSRRIYLSFDTDTAGINATNRGAELLKNAFSGLGKVKQFDESHLAVDDDKYSCEIRVISPPRGKDPDEYIREEGAENFQHFIDNAPLLIDFQLNQFLKHKNDAKTPQQKSKLVKDIIPILQDIQNDVVRTEYIKLVAASLNINEEALNKEVQRTLNQSFDREINVKRIVTKSENISEKTQKNILSLYLISNSPFNFGQISEKIKDVTFTNEKLIIVKNTIDKLINTVNNVRELTESLFETFSSDDDVQKIISELAVISEAFNNLSVENFEAVIKENINKLEFVKREKEQNELKELYKDVNDDEIESLKIQMHLRDQIKKQIRTGDNND
ncbi:DNA primase [bacterium]|nr:DNA primase [bacterium]